MPAMSPLRFPLRSAAAAVLALPLAFTVHPAAAQTDASQIPLVLPKADCGAKPEHPGRLGSDKRKSQWVKDANAYLDCMRKAFEQQRVIAERYREAANATGQAYNDAVKQIREEAEANAD